MCEKQLIGIFLWLFLSTAKNFSAPLSHFSRPVWQSHIDICSFSLRIPRIFCFIPQSYFFCLIFMFFKNLEGSYRQIIFLVDCTESGLTIFCGFMVLSSALMGTTSFSGNSPYFSELKEFPKYRILSIYQTLLVLELSYWLLAEGLSCSMFTVFIIGGNIHVLINWKKGRIVVSINFWEIYL